MNNLFKSKFRVIQYSVLFVLLFAFGNSSMLDYLIKNRYLLDNHENISYISLLNRDGLNTQELKGNIEMLNISKPEAIVCLNCEDDILHGANNIVGYNSDSLLRFSNKSHTFFETKGMKELLDLISFDNTKYDSKEVVPINFYKTLDEIYDIDLKEDFEKVSYKISGGIIIVYSGTNHDKGFKLPLFINTIYTLIYDNYYDLTNFISLLVFFIVLVAFRSYLFHELKRVNSIILKEVIYLVIVLVICCSLFWANILLDYLLVILLLLLMIVTEHLVKHFFLNK